jgi:5-methylcytosine-specific restriction protein B
MTYIEYFSKFHQKVLEKGIFTSQRTITNEHWIGYSYGSYFSFSCVFVQKRNNLSVELYIDGGNNKKQENKIIFDKIYQDKLNIEKILGNLSWQRLNEKRACRIESNYSNRVSLEDNQEKIEEYINWQVEELNKFKNVFTELYGQNFSKLISEIDFSSVTNTISEREVDEEEQEKMLKNINKPNQILFGPPGTGKTFNTINKAIEIIENRFLSSEELKVENRKTLKDKFEEYKKAGQIEFVTFHQSYGYEEFVEGIKADLDSDEIKYKLEKGIFKKLSNLAELNYRKSTATISTKKDFDTLFKEQILDKLIDDEKLKISTPEKHFFITEVNEKTIFFEKAEGQTDHSLSIKTLKEMYETGKNEKIKGGLSVYYEPILNLFLENSLFDKVDAEPLKNYILIIDEINRGNISKIFGELITLIEPSKRIGADEEIKVKLPYSNDDFGVPQNLYILGTMNTADRSIALMDTALRRRFEFIEMLPDLEVLNDLLVDGINIKLMLEKINQRVEYLYDRDHTIGHAYFMSLKENATFEELENIFKNKIIPLLQEYFYDDWEKILMVLGKGFIEKKVISNDIFDYKVDDYLEQEKYVYKIKDKFDFSSFK